MPTFRPAEVTSVLSQRSGLQRLAVRMDDGADARAYALTDLVGPVEPGDRVVCNTTAVDRGLGTGGWHVVHWNLAREELELPGPDHVMKLRYTSLQLDAGTSELAHPEAVDRPLGSLPVVACTVHSQMAMVAMGHAHVAPGSRLAYVMTDGAALPLALSDLVASSVEAGLICGTVTAGHAFGGDLEAVTVASALGLARHVLDADAVVVSMGPGVVGTGTALGTTAIEAASVLDTADALGGVPVLCVRASSGDERERHAGISHHARTVADLARCTPLAATVPPEVAQVRGVVPCEVPDVPSGADLMARWALPVTTMGRDYEGDPLFFDAAVAAGALAASSAASSPPSSTTGG